MPGRPLELVQSLKFRITTQERQSEVEGGTFLGYQPLPLFWPPAHSFPHSLKVQSAFNSPNSSGFLFGLNVRMKHYFSLDLIHSCAITRDTSGQVQLEILQEKRPLHTSQNKELDATLHNVPVTV